MVRGSPLLGIFLLLGGCAGGGGGDDGPGHLSLTFTPATVVDNYFPDQLPAYVTVHTDVRGSTTAHTVYVLVTDSANTFGSVYINALGPRAFEGDLEVPANLGAGAHSGTLTVSVCADLHCNKPIGGGTVPYTVTVKQPVLASFTPSPFNVAALQGGTVPVEMTMQGLPWDRPVFARIHDASGAFRTDTILPTTSKVPNEVNNKIFIAQVPVPADAAAVQHVGTIGIDACADVHCNVVYGTTRSAPFTLQVLSILAGQQGASGDTDGPGATALLANPRYVAADHSGNVFFADWGNHKIRKITPAGDVSTIVDLQSYEPGPLAVDANDNLFYSDAGTIREITPAGAQSTRGSAYAPNAIGMAVDLGGNVYVSSYSNYSTVNGYVVKLAPDGTATNIDFAQPWDVVADGAGNVVVMDAGNDYQHEPWGLFRLAPDGTRTSILANTSGYYLTMDPDGNLLTSGYGALVYELLADGTQTPVVPATLYLDGSTPYVWDLAWTGDGRLILADYGSHVILQTTLP